NPSSGFLLIAAHDKILKIQLYGMDGRLSYQQNPEPGFTNMLDLSSHTKAIFLLEIKTIKRTIFQKIILR
ncbi:MAG: T9SS type A sorting domain-containing protein, partial [Bacteroidales bacterium]|nr:T9SS type A sorting domain-containing protein [Bacteroidales bacterium]